MVKSTQELKSYFVKYSKPTQGQFADLIDSFVHKDEPGLQLDENGNLLLGQEADSTVVTQAKLHIIQSDDDPMPGLLIEKGQIASSVGENLQLGLIDGNGNFTGHLAINANGHLGIGTSDPKCALHIKSKFAQTLRLEAIDHMYMEFYPHGPDERKGWFGYGSRTESYRNRMTLENSAGQLYLKSELLFVTSRIYVNSDEARILTLDGEHPNIYFRRNGTNIAFIGIQDAEPNNLRIDGLTNGGLVVIPDLSDIRLKKDIENAENLLPKILKMRLVNFRYLSDEESKPKRFGVIAQEFNELFPELVFESEREDGTYLSVDTMRVGLMAIKAVQELHSEYRDLKTKLEDLQKSALRIEA